MAKMSAVVNESKPKTAFTRATKLAGNILFILLLLVLTFVTIFMIQSKVNNNKTSFNGYRSYIVLSGSMNPAFDTGSLVIVKGIQPEDIQEGDIITFKTTETSDTTTTHRVVEVHNEQGLSFTTKGDANDVKDPARLEPEQVIGKVHFAIPYLGYVLHFASTRLGTYLLIILPLSIIIMLEIIKIVRQGKGKKEESEEVIEEIQTETEPPIQPQPEIAKPEAVVPPIKTVENITEKVQVHKEEPDVNKTNPILESINNNAAKASAPEKKVLEPLAAMDNNDKQVEIENQKAAMEMEERKRLTKTLQELNLNIDHKRDCIRELNRMLMDNPVKRVDADSVVSEMVSKAQLQWTSKVYHYKTQIEQLEKDLKNNLKLKQQEEQNLDHSVALLKEELKEKTNGVQQKKGV